MKALLHNGTSDSLFIKLVEKSALKGSVQMAGKGLQESFSSEFHLKGHPATGWGRDRMSQYCTVQVWNL